MLKPDSVQRFIICVAAAFTLLLPTKAQDLATYSPVEEVTQRTGDPELWVVNGAIAKQPFRSSSYAAAGRYFDKKDFLALAEKSYRTATLLDSTFSHDADRLLNDLLLLRSHNANQSKRLQARVDLFPTEVGSLLELAGIRLIEDEVAEADKLVRRAASIDDPDFAARTEQLGDRVAEAYAVGKRLQDISNLKEARVHNYAGQYAPAILIYRSLLRDYPGNQILLSELSIAYANNGEYASAVRYLDEAKVGQSDRLKLFDRNALLMRAGLYSEAAEDLVSYYRENPDDAAVSEMIEDLYPLLANFPQAKYVVESVRPDLIPKKETEFDPGIVQTSRQSEFGLTAYPWVRHTSITGSDYRYQDNAQGLNLTAFLNGRTGLTFGASTHGIRSDNRFTNLADSQERLSRIAIGVDLGGREFTQQNRQGSYRFTFLIGLSAYSTGKNKPFVESTIEHVSPSGIRSGLDMSSSEGIVSGAAPIASQFDSRVSSARLYVQNTYRSQVKFRASLKVLGVDNESVAQSNSILASDGIALVGVRVVPNIHVGTGFRQIDYERYVDVYWAPSLYRRVELWTEYEKRIDLALVRLRGGMAAVIDSDRPVLPFLEGSARGRLADQATIAFRAELRRDARSVRQLRFDSADQLLTVALVEASLTWHF